MPIGFEATAQGDNKIKAKAEKGTIRNVLDAVVQSDPRYEWEETDGVINISPKQNKSPILEAVVRSFKVNQLRRDDAIAALLELPEVKAKILSRRDFGNLPATPHDSRLRFSLSLRNITS